LTPEELINNYERFGFDVVAITDHRHSSSRVYNNSKFESEMLLLDACEVSSSHHWNKIRGKEKELTIWNHPERYGDSIQEVNRSGKDLVEATEHGDLYINTSPNSAKLIERTQIPPVFTDDAHNVRMQNHVAVYVNSEFDKDKVIRALKRGEYSLWKREIPE